MARAFDDASNQYLKSSSVLGLTAYPYTFGAWFFTDDDTVNQDVFCFTIDDNNVLYEIMGLNTTNKLSLLTFLGSGDFALVQATSNYSTNTWHHGLAVIAGSQDRRIYLDGGNKGTNTTDNKARPTLDATYIGVRETNLDTYERYMSGNIAEVAVWDVALTDSEAAVLGNGYSPLVIRPASLIAYWPLIGRLSPEIDRVGGYDMTLTNGPTTAAHPRVIYPVPDQVNLIKQGEVPMGRMYSVNNTVASISTATDLIEINAPTDAIVVVHSIDVTQETEFADAQSEMLDFLIHRASTSGSAGATPTAAPFEVGDAAFGGTVETGNTTQGTEGTVLHREAAHVANGFHWKPTPEERIVLSPSGRVVVELGTAPDDSVDFRVNAVFEEIGG